MMSSAAHLLARQWCRMCRIWWQHLLDVEADVAGAHACPGAPPPPASQFALPLVPTAMALLLSPILPATTNVTRILAAQSPAFWLCSAWHSTAPDHYRFIHALLSKISSPNYRSLTCCILGVSQHVQKNISKPSKLVTVKEYVEHKQLQ
jgi:hypothetical protein